MDELLRQRYNQVPYGSPAYAFTHPSHLGALARLVGLRTPSLKESRVLELGCGRGGNIIPMALGLPEVRFVGIDLADAEIAQGRQLVTTLNLQNIELKTLSIMDIDRDFGQYDYIIAHGVWSWVPLDVREKLLEVCDQNLSASGVAYISFSVQPGSNTRMALRELLMLHTRSAVDPTTQMTAARQTLNTLASCLAENQTPSASLLSAEIQRTIKSLDSALLHDLLAPVNDPFYFHQFMERAEAHGLEFVADALPRFTALEQFSPQVRKTVRDTARNVVEQEQWADVLAGQAFRRTILAHPGAVLDRETGWRAAREMYVGSAASPQIAPGIPLPSGQVYFTLPEGHAVGTTDPLAKALLLRLRGVWPESVPVQTLLAERASLSCPGEPPPPAPPSEDKLCSTLAAMVRFGLVEFDTDQPPCTITVSDRPRASALARLQAQRGEKVTTLRHEHGDIGPLHRVILAELDGSRSRESLLLVLASRSVPDPGADDSTAQQSLEQILDQILQDLARTGVLLA